MNKDRQQQQQKMAAAALILVFYMTTISLCLGGVGELSSPLSWAIDNQNLSNAVIDKDWSRAFLKCKVWQVEETMDAINCPYHYYCTTKYPQNYSIIADWVAMVLALASCIALTIVVVWELRSTLFGQEFSKRKARYCVPSGPIIFPLTLVVLSKGHGIDTVFPLSYIGPAWLQLLHISALGIQGYELYGVSKNLNAVVYEVSMALGLLNACLYVDGLTMPYYTGLQALTSSLSGICRTCVCRREALVAGGEFFYRGWSFGSFTVVCAVLSRLGYGLWWTHGSRGSLINRGRLGMEILAWGFTSKDVFYLMGQIPGKQQGVPYMYVVGPIGLMLVLVLYKRLWNLWVALKWSNGESIPYVNCLL